MKVVIVYSQHSIYNSFAKPVRMGEVFVGSEGDLTARMADISVGGASDIENYLYEDIHVDAVGMVCHEKRKLGVHVNNVSGELNVNLNN